jgi:hypothetical protein
MNDQVLRVAQAHRASLCCMQHAVQFAGLSEAVERKKLQGGHVAIAIRIGWQRRLKTTLRRLGRNDHAGAENLS